MNSQASAYNTQADELGKVRCPKCGNLVSMVVETDTWIYSEGTRKYEHVSYAPEGEGFCCKQRFVGTLTHFRVFPLEEANA
jgi:hypothetical protein